MIFKLVLDACLRDVTGAGLVVRMVRSIEDRSVHGSFRYLVCVVLSVTKGYSYIVFDDFRSLGLRGVSVFDCCLFGAHNP